ncbi:MAG TPA: hypothetical protein PLL77_14380 [Pyrinomonadaceae bacterium]|nr:hypothetical protein [Verrucomicrobiales bacterium]HRI04922.1 hypothetical protein [Pyrinomonadaceae bacterium]
MSAIIAFIAAAIVGKLLVPAGAKLISEALKGIPELPRTASGNVQKHARLVPLKQVSGAKSLRSRMTSLANQPSGDIAVVKQGMLEALASTSLYAVDSDQFRSRVDDLRNAATIEQVRTAGLALAHAAVQDHHHLVTSGVQMAVQNAAVKIGFGKIEALNSPLGNNIIRLAATDAIGRTIVTEMDVRPERDLKIEAEVIGVTDNTCHQILDEFYASLKDEGIEMSTPPRRKPTGGICELAATKAFLAKKLSPTRRSSSTVTTVHDNEDDRRVLMNRSGGSLTKAKLTS